MSTHSENTAPGDESTPVRRGIEQPLMIAFLLLALIPLVGIMYAQYAVSRVKAPLGQAAATSFEFGLLDREYRSDARLVSSLFTNLDLFESPAEFERIERRVATIDARMVDRIEELAGVVDRKTGDQAKRMQMDLTGRTEAMLQTTRQKLRAKARLADLGTVMGALITNLGGRLSENSSAATGALSAVANRDDESPSAPARANDFEQLTELLERAANVRDLELLAEGRESFVETLERVRARALTHPDPTVAADAEKTIAELFRLSAETNGYFETAASVLELRAQEATEHADARILRRAIINTLARSDEANQQATRNLLEDAGNTLSSSMIGLLLFFIASVVASLTVLHFYVRKQVVNRLTRLSSAIRRMNNGELAEPVAIEGNDELTEIAAAVEKARAITIQMQENERLLELRNRELESANAELDKFAYVASHDLKSPLRAIQSLADFLEEDLGKSLEEDSKRHFELLRGRVSRMSCLLDSLLEYSRVGRRELVPELFDLHTVVLESAMIVTPTGGHVEVIGDFDVVKTWKTPLEQVVRNLVDNAFKHSGDEGCQVWIECALTDSALQIAVCDTGPGIPSAYHSQIFEMFQTLKSRDEVEGSGMGLALLRKIADSFGASLEVESDPESRPGARFVVEWPLLQPGKEELAEFRKHAARDSKKDKAIPAQLPAPRSRSATSA